MLYAAYGSNINVPQMAFRCPTAKAAGAAVLKGYAILFRGWNGSAVLNIEPQVGSEAPVLLWEIQPADEAALDRYEGWPRLYRKEIVTVVQGGAELPAMVYVMNPGYPLGKTGAHYLGIILEGYEGAGFPPAPLLRAAALSLRSAGRRSLK